MRGENEVLMLATTRCGICERAALDHSIDLNATMLHISGRARANPLTNIRIIDS